MKINFQPLTYPKIIMQYRRSKTPGGTFFFTLVTYQRRKLFSDIYYINLLRKVIKTIKLVHSFSIDAFVLFPDHLHCIWTLPKDDDNYFMRWRLIKSYFTRECRPEIKRMPTDSRRKKLERCVWQRRFWEHQIRDDEDFNKHVDYIHYNPVKHGYVKSPCDWPYSSFLRYVKTGIYPINWRNESTIDTEIGNK